MTYHDNPNHPHLPRRGGFGFMAVLGVLGLLLVGALALTLMGGMNADHAAEPAIERTQTIGSGAVAPALEHEATGSASSDPTGANAPAKSRASDPTGASRSAAPAPKQ